MKDFCLVPKKAFRDITWTLIHFKIIKNVIPMDDTHAYCLKYACMFSIV